MDNSEEYFEIVPTELDVIKKTIEIMQKDAQEYKLLFGAQDYFVILGNFLKWLKELEDVEGS